MKSWFWSTFLFSLPFCLTHLAWRCSFLNVPYQGHCWSICPSYRYGFNHSSNRPEAYADSVLVKLTTFHCATRSLDVVEVFFFFCILFITFFFLYHFRLMKNQQLEQTPLYYWGILQATWMKGSVSATYQFYNLISGYTSESQNFY